jgi:CRISPR-associated protein Cas2
MPIAYNGAIMDATWLIVVSYDISDDRRRDQAAQLLLDYGVRVQRSVYECRLDTDAFARMKARLEALIDWETDSVRYYFLCRRCEDRIEASGQGRPPMGEPSSVVV